jgi:hypothetical protein
VQYTPRIEARFAVPDDRVKKYEDDPIAISGDIVQRIGLEYL